MAILDTKKLCASGAEAAVFSGFYVGAEASDPLRTILE